LEEARDYKEHV